jgi:hypothetical protein
MIGNRMGWSDDDDDDDDDDEEEEMVQRLFGSY